MLKNNGRYAPILTFVRRFPTEKLSRSCRKGPAELQQRARCRATAAPL